MTQDFALWNADDVVTLIERGWTVMRSVAYRLDGAGDNLSAFVQPNGRWELAGRSINEPDAFQMTLLASGRCDAVPQAADKAASMLDACRRGVVPPPSLLLCCTSDGFAWWRERLGVATLTAPETATEPQAAPEPEPRHYRTAGPIRWCMAPNARRGFPVAAVVWMPDGPQLAVIDRSGDLNPTYCARLGGERVTGAEKSPRRCRALLGEFIARAHAQQRID